MQKWRIQTGSTDVEVEAEGWLDALTAARGSLNLRSEALARLSCAVQRDGSVVARDLVNGTEIRVSSVQLGKPPAFRMPSSSFPNLKYTAPEFVTPVLAPQASVAVEITPEPMPPARVPPPPVVAPHAAPVPVEAPPPVVVAPPIVVAPPPIVAPPPPPIVAAPPPPVVMPLPPVIAEQPEAEPVAQTDMSAFMADSMMEMLFLELGELSMAEGVAEASGIALRIVLGHVPAEAGAVLIRTRSGEGLRFRAASGPASRELIDTVIPLGKGIAGQVDHLGIGILIEDVRADIRHNNKIDRSTGFVTRSMLAVPVRADVGATYGCLELINPPRPFTGIDFELAARVAASLGVFLHSAYAAS